MVAAAATGVVERIGTSFSGPDAARFREFCGGGCVGEDDWACSSSA